MAFIWLERPSQPVDRIHLSELALFIDILRYLVRLAGVAEDFIVRLSARFMLAVNEPTHLVEQKVAEADSALVLAGKLVFAERFGVDAPHVT